VGACDSAGYYFWGQMMDAFEQWIADTVAEFGGEYKPKVEPLIPDAPLRPDYANYQKAYISGVYFLMAGDDVLYVGQSKNVYSRIAQHMANAQFEFDHFVITECHADHLLSLEAKFINELNPRWNKEIPAYGGSKHSLKKWY
jgi:GIY-YIG catalytic domain